MRPNKQWEHFSDAKPHIYRRYGAWWLHIGGGAVVCVISDDFRECLPAFREACGKSRAI